MARKLVEDDQVFAIYQLLGTPTNTVRQKYLNQKKVPQLLAATGASKWGMPEGVPVTMGWPRLTSPPRRRSTLRAATTRTISRMFVIGILYQNDDSGKDYSGGFLDGLGKEISSTSSPPR